MRIKHGSIALILIQLFVISAIVGALSPTVSATNNEANTTTSNPDFPELPAREEIGFDWFDRADDFKPKFVSGEVLVEFRKTISASLANDVVTTGIATVDELNKRFEARGIERLFSDVYKLTLPKDADVLSVARRYAADPNVECAEPNYIYRLLDVPDDTEYWKQWAHGLTQAELAWNTTTGDPSVVIAILDTGVQWNHTDLAANIWNNTDEEIGDSNGDGYPGVAGVDDDGDGLIDEDSNGKQPGEEGYTNDLKDDDDENGYVDDVRGWDFHDNNNDPMDDYGHGTHCAGIASAVGNNGKGVAGVSWNSSIMAVKLSPGYSPTSATIAKGIKYAANNDANIISMSFGGPESDIVHNAVIEAFGKGVLLVAAAGNSAMSYPRYPAAWSEVVSVSATDSGDDPASFTNFGDWVEVAAPGVHIYSTLPNNAYGYASGTSMSTPYVAGVAALIWSQFGLENMNNSEVRNQLLYTTDDLGELGFDQYYGYGRVNARWAVDHVSPEHDLRLWGMQTPKVLKPQTEATINCTVFNFGSNEEKNVFVRLLVNGSMKEQKKIRNIQPYEWANVSFSWTPQNEGKYNVKSYVMPEDNENLTNNNALSTRVIVRVEEVVRVPEDFSTIHRAVSAVNSGYTVEVSNGTYYEYVDIEKPLTLTATDPDTAIIDGGGGGDPIIHVHARAYIANVSISQFIIRNGGMGIFTEAPYYRLYFSFSSNAISGNKYGILLTATLEASIERNVITNNDYGCYVTYHSYRNILDDNVISNNTIAGIYASDGDFTASGNNISINGYGMYLYDSFAMIYHNNFIDNTRQLVDAKSWPELDDGYPSGGNYWSDYTNQDLYSGPYQNETGSDGIWDHPYTINQDTQDDYPLTRPWGSIRNVDTGLIYLTIQKAIDATETLDGHTIEVKAGTYYENVVVDKSLTLVGEDANTTIIDGQYTYYDTGFLVYANDTTITGFTLQKYTKGIEIWGCNCNVSGNPFGYNYDYYIYLEEGSSNNIISNNDLSTSGGKYGIYLKYSDNNTISGNTVTGKFIGIYMLYSNHNTIKNNTFNYCTIGPISWHSGMYIRESNNNVISDNTVTNNEDWGIFLDGDNNTVSGNIVSDNEYVGIGIYGLHNSISNNVISSNWLDGISLHDSNNSVSGNTITNNGGKGVYVDCGEGIYVSGSYNTIIDNTISENIYGIWLQASNNFIYHNNFVNNTNQTYVLSGKTSVWDDGYPSGGNYWNDYTGVDEKNGPNQDQPGSDGIGDTPYVIDENNQDDYPLMHPWGSIRNVDTGLIYLTIQKAIDAPETSDGDAIEVKAGTYYENVVVNKSLTLIGEDPSNTIIDGGGTGNVVTVQANNVRISQFTIQGSYFGVHLEYVQNSTVSNNIVSNNIMVGIWLTSSDGNVVSGNTISDAFEGIKLEVECNDNTISDNKIHDGDYGIHQGPQCNLTNISNNIISNLTKYGIWIEGLPDPSYYSSGNNIINNTVSNVVHTGGPPGGYGLCLLWCSGNSIIDNTLSNNDVGIWLAEASSNTIKGNTIINNVEVGIDIFGDYNTIVENNIRYNGEGIHITSFLGNHVIHHNNFINNTVQVYSTGLDNTWISTNHVGNYWSDYNGTDADGDGIGDTPYVIDEDDQDDYPLMWKWFPGDLDGDGYVGSNDLAIFSDAYGSQMGDPNYNKLADLDYDGDVDIDDLFIFSGNYGKSDP